MSWMSKIKKIGYFHIMNTCQPFETFFTPVDMSHDNLDNVGYTGLLEMCHTYIEVNVLESDKTSRL